MAARAEANTGSEQRPQQIRAANERVAREAERQRFLARLPMLCECDEEHCEEVLLIGAADFRSVRSSAGLFVTVPHHRPEHAELERKLTDYWLQRRG